MYIPKNNLMTDKQEIIAFMKQYSFATVITSKNNIPVATHLPVIIIEEAYSIKILSHFAKANTQWQDIEEHTVLIVFSEPHAYISPRHYDKEENVPTWNYVAVHAYGKAKLIRDASEVFSLLEKTIDTFEAAYQNQWQHLSSKYKNNMINGIVAFEIIVTDLEGKKKLSQNKTAAEQEKIISALSVSNNTVEKEISEMMKIRLNNVGQSL